MLRAFFDGEDRQKVTEPKNELFTVKDDELDFRVPREVSQIPPQIFLAIRRAAAKLGHLDCVQLNDIGKAIAVEGENGTSTYVARIFARAASRTGLEIPSVGRFDPIRDNGQKQVKLYRFTAYV